jgi:hypothetical protein
MLFGCVFSAPLGLAFGLALALLVAPAVRARAEGALDGFDRELLRGGLWTTAVGLGCVAADGALRALDFVVVAAGLLSVAAAVMRLAQRRMWLARVREGRIAGWRIEARTGDQSEAALAPFVRARIFDGVLVAHEEEEQLAPYRDTPPRRAVALVP